MQIIKEIKDLIHSLSTEEYEGLKTSLLEHGQRDDIQLGFTKEHGEFILDGHNRHEILTEADNKCVYGEPIRFESLDDAKIWIINNQFSRRNLTAYLRGELALKLESLIESRQGARTDLTSVPIGTEVEHPHRQSAKNAQVGHNTYAKIKFITENASEEVKDSLRAGDTSIHAEYEKLKRRGAHVQHNSGDNERDIPKKYIEAAREIMGTIDLDPASSESANEVVGALKFYNLDDSSLEKEWNGSIWLNPPYSQPLIGEFAEKLVKEIGDGNTTQACVLVNNATDTSWCQLLLGATRAICFIKGKIKFWSTLEKRGSPLQGQIILYYGDEREKFKETFSKFGEIAVCD